MQNACKRLSPTKIKLPHQRKILLLCCAFMLSLTFCSNAGGGDSSSNSSDSSSDGGGGGGGAPVCTGIPAPLTVYSPCPGSCPESDDAVNTAYVYTGTLLVSYSFDLAGFITTVNYTYDASNNLTFLINPGSPPGKTYTFSGGKLITEPTSTFTFHYTWGANGLVESFQSKIGATLITTCTFTYNSCDLVTTKSCLEDATAITTVYDYTYDGNNRLIKLSSIGFTLDNYTYDANGRLSADNVGTYTYDADGNLTNDGTVTYTYAVGTTDGRPKSWFTNERYFYGLNLGN